jgi:hypothetical protein
VFLFLTPQRSILQPPIAANEPNRIGPALAAVPELADDLFILGADRIQQFLGRGDSPAKIRLGDKRHDIHDKSPQLLYLAGN